MTSPKGIYKRGGRVASRPPHLASWAIQEADDEALPAELRDLVETWRTHYALAVPTPRKDVMVRLRALADISDQDARAGVAASGPWTIRWLETAALRAFRRACGADASIPPDELDALTWSAERIRAMARLALKHGVPGSTGGVRSTRATDRDFMALLHLSWSQMHRRTLSVEHRPLREWMDARAGKSFPRFARAVFALAGRDLKGDSQLRALHAAAKKLIG